ncbi:MAG: type II toxin-antitoxin system PrlF family antitoxin [Gammaproteobacteria bacterium]|nr:type II toxin-antitoxin system PrlF family antitoxin [Gammaproteobacteria bacterium]MDE0513414.1 type II toxin-antitoxin system PrlF family antitoxin [Gammaproteobacteria bacterium]
MISSTLTGKWQTTIPAEVRKVLHLKPRQRLIYELVEGAVLVRPQLETLKDLYGFLADGKVPITKSEERGLARKARATRYK